MPIQLRIVDFLPLKEFYLKKVLSFIGSFIIAITDANFFFNSV